MRFSLQIRVTDFMGPTEKKGHKTFPKEFKYISIIDTTQHSYLGNKYLIKHFPSKTFFFLENIYECQEQIFRFSLCIPSILYINVNLYVSRIFITLYYVIFYINIVYDNILVTTIGKD